VIAKFKDHEGVMSPVTLCKSHDVDGRTIYDVFEVDPEQEEVR
jgi:hypothetical protein